MSDQSQFNCCPCDGELCALCAIIAWYIGGFLVPEPNLTDEQLAAVHAYLDNPSDDNMGPTYEVMRASGLPAWGEPANV